MAYYAAVASLVELLKKINNPEHPYSKSLLDKQQIHVSLYEKFNLLLELLEDYSPKDHKEESVDSLESRIRDSAHEAQDVIESQISQRWEERRVRNIVDEECHQELDKVKDDVDSIVEELVVRIRESHTARQEELQHNSGGDEGASRSEAPSARNNTVGFDEHLMTTIKGQLCGESSRFQVVSLVGMGGIGKTTLTRQIFDDELIVYHFYCRAWVTVSKDYHLREVLLDIGNSMNILDEKLRKGGIEALKVHIYKYLKGRRYLIIMDDVWDTKVWDDVKRILPDDTNGSRIMITTRLTDVASSVGTCGFLHHMLFFSKEQSWSLLCQKVFCPPELEDTGRLIADNCQGLPLTIVVVAGLLSKVNPTRSDWEEIARNMSSIASENDERFSKVLSLSYHHLPHHLKPCFLYLGGFPKSYDIPVSKLIKMWVAEGFLKPIESKSLEEAGREYLEDLINRNLVLVNKRSNGKSRSCSLHDLLRDLCSERARYELFFHTLRKRDNCHGEHVRNVRRLSSHMWDDSLLLKYITEHSPHVHSALSFDETEREHDFLSATSSCKLLRVLDTGGGTRSEFPNEIVQLLHLRFLALRADNITIPPPIFKLQIRFLALGADNITIPPPIFKLQNLQTLIVHHGAISLPSEIWRMPQLRHVKSEWGVRLPPIPYDEVRIIDGVPLLGSLQTLSRVIDFRFTSDTIEMIPSLKKLKATFNYHCGQHWQEFGLENLVRLHELETLEIVFSLMPGISDELAVPSQLPESFFFPPNLKKLVLEGCRLPWKDMTAIGLLPNLQQLKLDFESFLGDEWEPIEGEFPKLKFLTMNALHDLQRWRAENTHFPCLEQLHIKECWLLEEIPPEIGEIPSLQLIEVHHSRLAAVSATKIQEEQRSMGNDVLQVSVYPDYRNFKPSDQDTGTRYFFPMFENFTGRWLKGVTNRNSPLLGKWYKLS